MTAHDPVTAYLHACADVAYAVAAAARASLVERMEAGRAPRPRRACPGPPARQVITFTGPPLTSDTGRAILAALADTPARHRGRLPDLLTPIQG